MKYALFLLILFSMETFTIFDFNKNADLQRWKVVDDVVMGGKSSGSFSINSDGHGVFFGTVSLENNGGFSSVRYQMNKTDVANYSKVILKVKGDGKKYQFRIKDSKNNYYSYIAYFETSGKWEEIEIPLKDLYPSFRGRKVDKPNFDKSHIEEIAFLIANSKAEEFKLLIDQISLR